MHSSRAKPHDRSTLHATLHARLIPLLLLQRYEPGRRVPAERELAGRFGVSRGQIREALASLEALRVIERRAKSGIYMAAEENSLEALALFAQLGVRLTEAALRQAAEIRRVHEVAAIRLACERRTDANLARLGDILAAEAAHIEAAESIAAEDRLFHTEIARCTQNGLFVRTVSLCAELAAAPCAPRFPDAAHGWRTHEEHLRLRDAIAARQGERAEHLMTAHLRGADATWQMQGESDDQRAPAA